MRKTDIARELTRCIENLLQDIDTSPEEASGYEVSGLPHTVAYSFSTMDAALAAIRKDNDLRGTEGFVYTIRRLK